MDNHPSHHSKHITEYIEERDGECLFMPPTSSYFNPIETIWSYIKFKWRNKLTDLNGEQPNKKFMEETLK